MPAAATASCDESGERVAPRQDLALEVVGLVNDHRASIGRGPLALSPALMRAALWKSNHMVVQDYFSHDDQAPPVQRTAFDRMRACGYTGGTMGENIAYGSQTAAGVMQQWLNSTGHRDNIENPSYTQIGVGAAGPARHWTQNFGAGGGVEPIHARPLAIADELTMREDGRASAALTTNDRDTAGWLHLTEVESLRRLTATVTADGRGVTLLPAPDFFGTVELSHTVADLMGQTSVSTLTVRVRPVNDAPQAGADSARLRRKARRVGIRVLRNDSDVDGDRLRVRKVLARPAHGRARVVRGKRIVYRPDRRWPGADAFTYRVADGEGGRARATVEIVGPPRR